MSIFKKRLCLPVKFNGQGPQTIFWVKVSQPAKGKRWSEGGRQGVKGGGVGGGGV